MKFFPFVISCNSISYKDRHKFVKKLFAFYLFDTLYICTFAFEFKQFKCSISATSNSLRS